MTIDELKKQRFIRLLQAETTARTINDVYKDVKVVHVSLEIIFKSAVLRDLKVKKYQRTIEPSDRLYLHYDCENKDCTSDGFDLTSELRNALASRRCVEGVMHCTGKEDWKYVGASGFSCMTTLKYRIEPEFGQML